MTYHTLCPICQRYHAPSAVTTSCAWFIPNAHKKVIIELFTQVDTLFPGDDDCPGLITPNPKDNTQ